MCDKVSIIIPAYNIAAYLTECVDSLLQQSCQGIEIVIVNDGSTDNTAQVCGKIAIKDNRIKVIHKSNGGVSSARNVGLKESTGQYVMFVDGDDWLEPFAVQLLLDTIKRTRTDVCFCSKYYRNSDKIVVATNVDAGDVYSAMDLLKKHVGYMFLASPCLSLTRKDIALKAEFNTSIHTLEDWEYNFQILTRTTTISIIDKPYYHYRAVEGSASKSPLNKRKMTCFKIIDTVNERVKELPIDISINTDNVPCFLIYHMLVIYSGNGSIENTASQLKQICRKWLPKIWSSKYISGKSKLYVLLGTVSPNLFKCLYNLKNAGSHE